jgi:hypothetical protein
VSKLHLNSISFCSLVHLCLESHAFDFVHRDRFDVPYFSTCA